MGTFPEIETVVPHTKHQHTRCIQNTENQLKLLQVHIHPCIHCTVCLFYSVVHRCNHLALIHYNSILTTLSIPAICNTTSLRAAHHQSQQQVFMNHEQEDCPPWFYSDKGTCKCLAFYGATCFDNKAYLSAGFCATFDTSTDSDSDILSLGECPSYYGFTFTKHNRLWYVQLPDNVSELNDYMCGPLNRKGRLCSECKDGYGLGTTSVGFQHFECTKCAGAWYGVPLFLFLEMFPLTVLYFIILLFQVNITSGSIPCFIFCAQLLAICFDRVFAIDDPRVSDLILAATKHTNWLFTLMITIYDVWNLRFFRNILPSFCISSGLKRIHISYLDYISVFYPMCYIDILY